MRYSTIIKMSKNGLNGDDVVNDLSPNDQTKPLLASSCENFYPLYDKDPFETTRLFLKLFKKMCSLGILKSVDFLDDCPSIHPSHHSAFRSIVLDEVTLTEVGQLLFDIEGGDWLDSNVSELSSTMTSDAYSKTEVTQLELHLPRFCSDFVLISHIGKGGFGKVVKARNLLDEGHYAVKILSMDDFRLPNLNKILQETKSLAKLEHPKHYTLSFCLG